MSAEDSIALSPKLQADYTELVNQCLDKAPLKEGGDFQKYEIALQTLLKENKVEADSEALKGRVSSIKEMLDSPELYGEPQHQTRFKKIISDRIASKIQELRTMSPEEKIKKQ